jgi:hypothetical protein
MYECVPEPGHIGLVLGLKARVGGHEFVDEQRQIECGPRGIEEGSNIAAKAGRAIDVERLHPPAL